MKQPTPPKVAEGINPVRLSAPEFQALLDRVGPDQADQAKRPTQNTYGFTLGPIAFWIPRDEWEGHLLKGILHNCAAKWKDVLSEPTLQKIRALLPAASPSAQGAAAPETC